MMSEQRMDGITKMAWRGDAPPPGYDPLQYLCLRAIYREYRRGELEQSTAAQLKEFCMSFEKLPPKERRSLMIFALDSEFKYKGWLEDIERLTWAILKDK